MICVFILTDILISCHSNKPLLSALNPRLTAGLHSNLTDFVACYFGLYDSTSIKHVTVKKIQEF